MTQNTATLRQTTGDPPSSAGDHLLVVDDFEGLLAILETALTQHGFPVTTTTTAAGAREVLQQKPVALILLDIGLPDVSGLELIGEFKSAFPTPPSSCLPPRPISAQHFPVCGWGRTIISSSQWISICCSPP